VSGVTGRLTLRPIGFRNAYLYLLIGAFFISSDDTLFVVNVPFALRLSIIMLAGFIVVGLLKITQQVRVTLPYGYLYLLGWAAASVFSLLFTPVLYFSVVQTMFFLFDVVLVFAMVNIATPGNFPRLLNFYFMSFGVMAAFGLLQFFGGLVGLNFLAKQHWTAHLNRINGLSYEPSYYAVYISAGLITLGYLKYKKFEGLKRIGFYYNLTLAAMILSSSRTGESLVAIWYARLLPAALAPLLRGKLTKNLARGLAAAGLFMGAVVLFVLAVGPSKFIFLLSGTGLYGTAAHSYDDRSNWTAQTWQIFTQHPIFGTGIGGVNYYCEIIRKGFATQDPDILKTNPGANVTFEVAASVGIFGFAFVFLYFMGFLRRIWRLGDRNPVITGLTLGLVAELYLLQFTQDIQRIYLWLHIGMLCAAIKVYGPGEKPIMPRSPSLMTPTPRRAETV